MRALLVGLLTLGATTSACSSVEQIRPHGLSPRLHAYALELIRQLGDDSPFVRQRAEAELVELGPEVVPVLKIAWKKRIDEEIRDRARRIVRRFEIPEIGEFRNRELLDLSRAYEREDKIEYALHAVRAVLASSPDNHRAKDRIQQLEPLSWNRDSWVRDIYSRIPATSEHRWELIDLFCTAVQRYHMHQWEYARRILLHVEDHAILVFRGDAQGVRIKSHARTVLKWLGARASRTR